MEAYRFNSEAKYTTSDRYPDRDLNLSVQTIQVTKHMAFTAHLPDVWDKYLIDNLTSEKLIQAWSSNPTQFWQNQLHFAVWCASTGCGVSTSDHLNAPDPFIRSLYRFHVYYQIRRILTEMKVENPQDPNWDAFNSAMDRRAYERISAEFGVDPKTDWRRTGDNNGLGIPMKWHNGRVITIKEVSNDLLEHEKLIPSFRLQDNTWRDDRMSFHSGRTITVDKITQPSQSSNDWTHFI